MENRKNRDQENFWYKMNLELAESSSERRRVKRMFDRNLLNSKVVNTLHAIVFTAGIAFGIYQAYKEEIPSPVYETVEHKMNQTYLDGLITIIPW